MEKHIKYYNHLKSVIEILPDKPGIYQFIDKKDDIIYIGKAKNLKKRVTSYFNKTFFENRKLYVLVKKIADIKFIVVGTESDALLLENNLIKKEQPRYNILLKDDKTYPWICIKKEPFPRIFPTRKIINDGSFYFGPYTSAKNMNTVLNLIKQIYPVRTCNYNLNEKNIKNKKFKLCLEYYIGNCKGPCQELQTEKDYNKNIQEIKQILKGNINAVNKQLNALMNIYADKYEFEKAQDIKEKIFILKTYQTKSIIVNPKINNTDVYSIISDQNYAYVNFLKIINGAIIQSHTVEIKKKLDENIKELLTIAIMNFRQKFIDNTKKIIISSPVDTDFFDENLIFTIPKKGDKKKLVNLSERNAKYFKLKKQRQRELLDPQRHTKRILNKMKKDLRLKELPVHIECFDNSNIQGEYPVSAMVVFKNAKPYKKGYRHYNIKTVKGPNDFASMEEVIYRRYKRLLDEKKSLPQLIVVDGGKGQISAAIKSLEKLNIKERITIIGIAKKLEEIYYPNDPIPLYLDKKSETLKIIQHIRDQAHHFGITHHRKKRSKQTIKTELTGIKGIGNKISQTLLKKFKSVKNIKSANLYELQKTIGKAKGKIVFKYFNTN